MAALYFMGSVVLVGGAVVLLVLVPWARGHAVGPDAGDMARDPMLHMELDDTTASKIYTQTPREGGLALNTGRRTSSAFRVWDLHTPEDGQALLLAAVNAGLDHGVVWRGLRCQHDAIRFEGYKRVEADGTLVDSEVSVLLSGFDGQHELNISLSSDGGYVNREDHAYSAPYIEGDPCPPEVAETFQNVQTDPLAD